MTFRFSPQRTHLILSLTPEERAAIQQLPNPSEREEAVEQYLENLLANSELTWILPEETGDLTDAPILGILGEETTQNKGPHGARQTGVLQGNPQFEPILERWGFMNYQIAGLTETLALHGEAYLWNGN